MNKKPTCYECVHLKDTFENHVECMLYAEKTAQPYVRLLLVLGTRCARYMSIENRIKKRYYVTTLRRALKHKTKSQGV